MVFRCVHQQILAVINAAVTSYRPDLSFEQLIRGSSDAI